MRTTDSITQWMLVLGIVFQGVGLGQEARKLRSPKDYVRIVEMAGNQRIILYDPRGAGDPRQHSTQFFSDTGSAIFIELLAEEFSAESTLDQLLISAQLKHDRESVKVEVLGYTMVGQDENAAAAQKAVAFRTLSDVQAAVENIYYTSKDIVGALLPECKKRIEADPEHALNEAGCKIKADMSALGSLAKYKEAEFKTLPAFFANPRNAAVAAFAGNEIFGVDTASLQAIAGQFQKDSQILFESTDAAVKAAAAQALLERTTSILRDFYLDYKEKAKGNGAIRSESDYILEMRKRLVQRLKDSLVDGQITLAQYKAAAGDGLVIRIEARGGDRSGPGATVEFEAQLRSFGNRTAVSPSMFFIKRIGVSEKDVYPPGTTPLQAVRFAPSPGVTLGLTHRHRGLAKTANGSRTEFLPTGGGKLLSFLTPGVGMNVSFMNFDDGRDFNPVTGKFTNTNGSTFQVGAGPVVSLFDNQLQFTFGWNLQAGESRTYWGVGFGFIEIGKTLGGYLK